MKPIYFKNEKFSLFLAIKSLQFIEKSVGFLPFTNYYQQVRKQKYEKTFKN